MLQKLLHNQQKRPAPGGHNKMKMLNKSMETVKVDDNKVFKFYMLSICRMDPMIL